MDYFASRILVVDDTPANLALLQALLEEAGYEHVMIESDPRNVALLHVKHDFDLILLDLRMPHLDGFGVMQQLRERSGEQDFLPVLVLTAQNDRESRHRALASGARDFLTKPFEVDEVLLRIRNQLEVRHLYRQRTEQEARLQRLLYQRTEQLTRGQQDMAFLARHDPVTLLPNRTVLFEKIEEHLDFPADKNAPDTKVMDDAAPKWCLFMVELDGFRYLDTLEGYEFGDEVLRVMGRRMDQAVALRGGFVAFWGSAVFAILLPSFAQEDEEIWLEDLICEPLTVRGFEVAPLARLGSVVLGLDGGDSATLLRRVVLALRSCPSGSRFVRLAYSSGQEEAIKDRQALELDLRSAIERDELELFYQPKLDLLTNRVMGAEGLVRWRHPERGMVMPGQFIELAEETGMIEELGLWAIRRAITDARTWEQIYGRPLSVAVNVSTRQLDLARVAGRSLAKDVEEILQSTDFNPALLELELTESSIMQDVDYALSELQHLHRLGVNLAIDDFGTGHSSLAYLCRLCVNTLKVDRTFVSSMASNQEARVVVRSILALGHELGLTVVAEGIETNTDLEILRDLNCDLGQGYLFSRPLPKDVFNDYLYQHSTRKFVN